MKAKIIRLIDELRKDSRRSLTQLSIKTEIPLSTVFKALIRLEKEKIIKKYVSFIDFEKIGFALKTGIFIRTSNRDEVKEFLSTNPMVNTLLKISGEYQCYAEMLFRNMEECQDFIDQLEWKKSVKKVKPVFLTDVKLEEFRIKRN